ncbi:unnamed protein product, partial [Protopolystoma xenopodis]
MQEWPLNKDFAATACSAQAYEQISIDVNPATSRWSTHHQHQAVVTESESGLDQLNKAPSQNYWENSVFSPNPQLQLGNSNIKMERWSTSCLKRDWRRVKSDAEMEAGMEKAGGCREKIVENRKASNENRQSAHFQVTDFQKTIELNRSPSYPPVACRKPIGLVHTHSTTSYDHRQEVCQPRVPIKYAFHQPDCPGMPSVESCKKEGEEACVRDKNCDPRLNRQARECQDYGNAISSEAVGLASKSSATLPDITARNPQLLMHVGEKNIISQIYQENDCEKKQCRNEKQSATNMHEDRVADQNTKIHLQVGGQFGQNFISNFQHDDHFLRRQPSGLTYNPQQCQKQKHQTNFLPPESTPAASYSGYLQAYNPTKADLGCANINSRSFGSAVWRSRLAVESQIDSEIYEFTALAKKKKAAWRQAINVKRTTDAHDTRRRIQEDIVTRSKRGFGSPTHTAVSEEIHECIALRTFNQNAV